MKDRSTFTIRVETIIGIEIRITPGNRIWFILIQFPEDPTTPIKVVTPELRLSVGADVVQLGDFSRSAPALL